jgi:Putative Actinobacterial Holin-X, holin superfamily III
MAADTTVVLEERPLRELISRLARDASHLVEQELALAKQEVREKADDVQAKLVAASLGVAVLHVGLLAIVAALILLLAEALPSWGAAFLVGALCCIVGGVMFSRSKQQIEQTNLKPVKTIDSVERDVKAIKEAAQ